VERRVGGAVWDKGQGVGAAHMEHDVGRGRQHAQAAVK